MLQNIANIGNLVKAAWQIKVSVPAFVVSAGDLATCWLVWYVYVNKGSVILSMVIGAVGGFKQWLFG